MTFKKIFAAAIPMAAVFLSSGQAAEAPWAEEAAFLKTCSAGWSALFPRGDDTIPEASAVEAAREPCRTGIELSLAALEKQATVPAHRIMAYHHLGQLHKGLGMLAFIDERRSGVSESDASAHCPDALTARDYMEKIMQVDISALPQDVRAKVATYQTDL